MLNNVLKICLKLSISLVGPLEVCVRCAFVPVVGPSGVSRKGLVFGEGRGFRRIPIVKGGG